MVNRCPQEIKESLARYVQGCPTGDFLQAVLGNDLRGACERADDINQSLLFDIVYYIYNELPAACWGSPAKVQAWLERFRKDDGASANGRRSGSEPDSGGSNPSAPVRRLADG